MKFGGKQKKAAKKSHRISTPASVKAVIEAAFAKKSRKGVHKKKKYGGRGPMSASKKKERLEAVMGEIPFQKGVPTKARRYCRCVANVAGEQTPECLKRIAKGKDPRKVKGCYNPWAICGRKRPAGVRGCATFFDYKNMPEGYTEAYASLRNKSVKELLDAASKEMAAVKRKRR